MEDQDSEDNEWIEKDEEPIERLEGGYGWAVVGASFVAHILTEGCSFATGILYEEMLREFGEGGSKTAWINSLIFGIPLLFGPLAGACVTHIGCKKVSIVGGGLSSLGFGLSYFASSVEALMISLGFIAGLGMAFGYMPATVIIAYYFKRRFALATGLAVCGTGIGTFIMAPLLGYLIEVYSWRGAMVVMAGLMLNLCVCAFVYTDNDRELYNNLSKLEDADTNESSLCPASTESDHLDDRGMQSNEKLPGNQPVPNGNAPILLVTQSCHLQDDQNHQLLPKVSGRKSLSSPYLLNESPESKRGDHLHSLNDVVFERPHRHRSKSFLSYRNYASVMSVKALSEKAAEQNFEPNPAGFKSALKNAVKDMFNMKVLTNRPFLVYFISTVILNVFYDFPYIYLYGHAVHRGSDLELSSLLVSFLGLATMIGELLLGFLGDHSWCNKKILYASFLFLCGLSMVLEPLCMEYFHFAIFSFTYGLFISANYSLAPIVVVQLLGVKRFANAYGVSLLGEGIANILGPPLAGYINDVTGSYDMSFYVGGAGIMTAAVIAACTLRFKNADGKKDPIFYRCSSWCATTL